MLLASNKILYLRLLLERDVFRADICGVILLEARGRIKTKRKSEINTKGNHASIGV